MEEHEQIQENILIADVSKEMKTSYLNYAMSVIVSRALPDARDGLKPVHRRILYDMFEMGLRASGDNKKSARIVGDVLGKYHPHGDASVYDALVRLAQDFSLRYPAVSPQGNFGSIDGDSAAAMRYTEAKMSKIGEVMLDDINKKTVDFNPNYDESLEEPSVLPAAFPFLLANGSSGIAVGMATNLAPHNLQEICDAVCAQIDNPDITLDELMEHIKGPDFPTGGIICGLAGIRDAFSTGRGKITIRSRYDIETDKKGRDYIVFTEIPYQVNKADLVKKIDDFRKSGVFDGISSVRDESDRKGIRVVVELKQGSSPLVTLNRLFARTALQSNFNVNNLALVNGRPELLGLKKMLSCYIGHRKEVVERRTRFDLEAARKRAHILVGLKKGLEEIDAVIAIIKQSENNAIANVKLQEFLEIDEVQAGAIIDMKLGRLSHMETGKILSELEDLEIKIDYYEDLLSSDSKILAVVKDETAALPGRLAPRDTRRTAISPHELGEMKDEDFIKREDVVILMSRKGFVKRIPVEDYKAQNRAGKGTITARLQDSDAIQHMFVTHSHDYVLYVSNYGKAYYTRGFDIPEAGKYAKGTSIKNFLQIDNTEKITMMINVEEFSEDHYLMMVTRKGVVKRVNLHEFRNARDKGIWAIVLDEGDQLVQTELVTGDDEVMIITRNGRGLRIKVDDVRAMGRMAHGVNGIRLRSDDEVVGLVKVNPEKRVLMLTETGQGKQVAYDEFMCHGRATQGQKIYRLGSRGRHLIGAVSVNEEMDVVCVTKFGQTVRVHVKDISVQGRNAAGVKVVTMKKRKDEVVAIAATEYEEEEEVLAEAEELTESSEQ